MIKKLLQFIILFAVASTGEIAHAQAPTSFKPGIYLTFEEFLNNSPGRSDALQVETQVEETISRMKRTLDESVRASQQSLTVYRLKDRNGKNFKGFKDFWGFSDGTFVYVNSTTHTKADHFVRLDVIGPICYFFQLGAESGLQKQVYHDPGDISNLHPVPQPKLYYLDQFVIDMKTGQISKLTKERLLQIVNPFPDLVEVSSPLHKQEIFIDVIRMYNFKTERKSD